MWQEAVPLLLRCALAGRQLLVLRVVFGKARFTDRGPEATRSRSNGWACLQWGVGLKSAISIGPGPQPAAGLLPVSIPGDVASLRIYSAQ